jgi:hypothetical protein
MDDFRDDLLGSNDIAQRMPLLGKLRPGIKVLKSGCTEQEKKIYAKMVADGALWYEIEQRLGNDAKGKSKLIPNNQDYFTVRPSDCKINPMNAEKLHKLYDDTDGHIRSVPIVFMFNDWFQNIPHKLVNWGTNGAKFLSDYRELDGKMQRVCTSPLPRKPKERPTPGKRPMHVHGPCCPETCEVYQKGYCKLHGYIQCIIPGTVGAGLWRIETTSIYSLQQIRQTMMMVQGITGGRLASLYRDQAPVFTIRKIEDTISRVDLDTGDSKKQDQDLIYLDANIDMAELALAYQEQAMLGRGQRAAAALGTRMPREQEQTTGQPPVEAPPSNDVGKQEEPEEAEYEDIDESEESETTGEESQLSETEEKSALFAAILPALNALPTPVKMKIRKSYPSDLMKVDLETLRKLDKDIKAAIAA